MCDAVGIFFSKGPGNPDWGITSYLKYQDTLDEEPVISVSKLILIVLHYNDKTELFLHFLILEFCIFSLKNNQIIDLIYFLL